MHWIAIAALVGTGLAIVIVLNWISQVLHEISISLRNFSATLNMHPQLVDALGRNFTRRRKTKVKEMV